ncbi:uncharacterized protein [Ptychodera flava]|uniref:uncharacterized protein n=1 Tax=Ptychodera flava TaxID=63121 RepID=UPI00396A7275
MLEELNRTRGGEKYESKKRRHSNEAQTSEVGVQTASTGEREVESGSKSKQARTAEYILVHAEEVRESAQVNPVSSGISEEPSENKSTKQGKRISKKTPFVDEDSEEEKPTTSQAVGFAQSDRQINQGINVHDQTPRDSISGGSRLDATRPQRKAKIFALSRMWKKKGKRQRQSKEIEIKVKPDGIIPEEDKTVGEVNDAFYSNTQTEINADQFGKDLDNRHKNMQLQKIGKSSISYVMTCRSLDALESLMDSYRNEGLQRTVTTTFVSDQLLRDIGAIYLSLGVSIDYEEYYLCQEELKDTEDTDMLGVDSKEQEYQLTTRTSPPCSKRHLEG